MNTVEKFTFPRSFDLQLPESDPDQENQNEGQDGEKTPAVEIVPPPVVFSEEELSTAKETAFASGKSEGIQEAQKDSQQTAATLLAQIGEHLSAIDQSQAEIAEKASRAAVESALAVVRKLFPYLAKRHGIDEIEDLIRTAIKTAKTEPRINIHVHPTVHGAISNVIQEIVKSRGYSGQIFVLEETTFAQSDCTVDWLDGGLERGSQEQWREIDQIIENTLGSDALTVGIVTEDEPEISDNVEQSSAETVINNADDSGVSVDSAADLSVPAASRADQITGETDGR